MRMRIVLLGGAALALALVAGGCGDDTSGQDMTSNSPDITVPPDLTMQPDLVPPPPTYSATVVLAQLSTVVPLPGVGPTPVNVLGPTVSFSSSALAKPADWTNIPAAGLPLGCEGNHYEVAKGDLPADDVDAGPLTLTGYAAPTLVTMSKAPAEINCAFDPMTKHYKCGYGPLMNGMPGPDPSGAPYLQTQDALPKEAMLNFKTMGKGPFGSFDKMGIVAAGPIKTTEDLTKLVFDPSKDMELNINCPDGMNGACGAGGVVVSVTALQTTPDKPNDPSPTFGAIRCAALTVNPKVTVKKEAIGAMLGCNAMGMNCDTKLITFRTVVLRIPLPGNDKDSKGNGLTLLAGKASLGISTKAQ